MIGSVNTPGTSFHLLASRVGVLEEFDKSVYTKEEVVQLFKDNTGAFTIKEDGHLYYSVPETAIYAQDELGSMSLKSDEEIAQLTGLNGGTVAGLSAGATSGADYAEMFEWSDGNPENQDRVGMFVAPAGQGKIKVAGEGDYVLGIVSGNPALIGNEDTEWRGKYVRDKYGRTAIEFLEEVEEEIDAPEGLSGDSLALWIRANNVSYSASGKLVRRGYVVSEKPTEICQAKLNPEWNPSLHYVPRRERSEWGCVGLMGVIPVNDDGSCVEGSFCRVGPSGKATFCGPFYQGQKFMVLKRIDDTTVSVLFK